MGVFNSPLHICWYLVKEVQTLVFGFQYSDRTDISIVSIVIVHSLSGPSLWVTKIVELVVFLFMVLLIFYFILKVAEDDKEWTWFSAADLPVFTVCQ